MPCAYCIPDQPRLLPVCGATVLQDAMVRGLLYSAGREEEELASRRVEERISKRLNRFGRDSNKSYGPIKINNLRNEYRNVRMSFYLPEPK